MATQTSAVASEFIYDTGEEVLPLGGYTGTIPWPTASATAALVAAKQFHLALVAAPAATPGAAWVVAHCLHVSPHAPAPGPAPKLKIYYCLPSPVAGTGAAVGKPAVAP